MKKYMAAGIVAVAIVVAVAMWSVSGAMHQTSTDKAGGGLQLSGPFALLRIGMTEAQVATLLGKAEAVSVYPKFEHKSASEWAKILEQANAAAAGSLSSDAAPSLKSIKAQAELTHRFRDVWEYKPSKTRMVTLYFGEDGTLLNVESTFIRVSAEGGHGK